MRKRRLLYFLGIVLALGTALYLARRLLFESVVTSEIRAALEPVLAADVEVGAVTGNWLTEMVLESVRIRGREGSAWRELGDISLTAAYSPWSLLTGDPRGLVRARIVVDKATLALDGAFAAGDAGAGPAIPLDQLLGILPEGATIEVRTLDLLPPVAAAGACSIELLPGKGTRRLTIRYGEHTGTATLGSDGAFALECDVKELGRGLQALGWEVRTTGAGTLALRLSGQVAPLHFTADVDARTELVSGQPVGAAGQATWSGGRLLVPKLEVDLPGIQIRGRDLDLPVQQLSRDAVARVLRGRSAGALEVSVADLTPYREWLSPFVAERMPVQAELALDLERGMATMRPSKVRAAGLELDVTGGGFSLLDLSRANLHRTSLRGVQARLAITRPWELPFGDGLMVQGTLTGTVAGSIDRPDIRAVADFGPTRYGVLRCTSIAGRLTYDGAKVAIEELRSTGLRRAGDPFTVDPKGTLTIHLAREDKPVRLESQLRADVPGTALALAGAPAPIQRALALPGFEVSGEVAFPPGDSPIHGTVSMKAPAIRYADLPPLSFTGTLSFDGARLEARAFHFAGELGELHVSGTFGDRLALQVRGEVPALAPLARVAGRPPVDGRLTIGPTTLGGTLASPTVDLDLRLALTRLDRAWWQLNRRDELPDMPLDLAVRARAAPDGITVQAFQLDWGDPQRRRIGLSCSGPAPLAWADDRLRAVPTGAPFVAQITIRDTNTVPGQPPVTLTSRVEITDTRVEVPTLKIETPNGASGAVTGTGLAAEVRVADLLAGRIAPGKWPVRGQLDIRDIDLGIPLFALLTGLRLGGHAAGQLTVTGPVLEARVTGELEVRDGLLARPGFPEVRGIGVQAKFNEHRASLSLRGGFAAEQAMVVTTFIDSGEAPLWRALQEDSDLPLNGELRVDDFDLSVVPRGWGDLTELQGVVSVQGKITGTARNLTPVVEIRVDNAAWTGPSVPTVHALAMRATVERDRVVLERCSGQVLALPMRLEAELGVEGTLWHAWRAGRTGQGPDLPLRGHVTVVDFPLTALPKSLSGCDDLAGNVSGSIKIGGSVRAPDPELDLKLSGGAVKVRALPRVADLDASVTATAKGAEVRGSGSLGAAPITLACTLEPGEGGLLDAWRNAGIRATAKGQRLLLVRGSGLKVRGNVDLTATGTLQKVEIRGKIAAQDGSKFIKRLSLVPDLRVRGGTVDEGAFGPWSIPGGERMHVDIQVVTEKPIAVRANVIDADVDVGCRLVGQGNALHLDGVCTSREGRLRFPGMSMRLQGMRLVFQDTNPTRPTLIATATGQRHGIRINLRVSGFWDEPVINLSSTPVLQPKDLWSLVTTGQRPASLAEGDTRSNTTLIATYVIQELVLAYLASESTEAQESFISRFTFEFGNEISRGGQETWRVDFDIGDLWVMPKNYGVRLERDVYEDINLGVVYRWRF